MIAWCSERGIISGYGTGSFGPSDQLTGDQFAKMLLCAFAEDAGQKYTGAEGVKAPKLNTLGSKEWSKTRSKVRSAVRDIAQDLVKLYAARQNKEGYACGPDTEWQKEFEEMFPYEETEDQREEEPVPPRQAPVEELP